MRIFDSRGYRRFVLVAIHVLVLASLSVGCYYFFRTQATRSVTGRFNYGEDKFAKYEEVRKEWRPRIGSTLLIRTFHDKDHKKFGNRIAIWFAIWFAAISVLYVLMDVRAALFLSAGTFAALTYACSPITENTWYPWDMPALFFGALTLLFAQKRWAVPLALAVVVAVPFKETILLMGLLFLFFDQWSWRRRIVWTAIALVVGYGVRLGIELYVGNPMGPNALSYHVNADPTQVARWRENLAMILSLKSANHVLFANLGTVVLVFLIPTKDSILRGIKWIAIPFYAGLIAAASLNEIRVFLEILPGALLLTWRFVQAEPGPAPKKA